MKFMLFWKGGRDLKRRLFLILTIAALLSALVLPVSAENTASRVDAYCTVYTDGDVQVNLTVTLRLEAAQDSLYFPLPGNATDISLNGAGARTSKTGSTVDVDVSRVVSGLVGEFSLRIDYTVPDAVKVITDEKTGERSLQLELPLISGFTYPVDYLSFVVVLPASATVNPRFTSTYRQTGIDSDLAYVRNGNMITGATKAQLNDHEAVTMILDVPTDMFPGVNVYIREGNPELKPMLIFIGAALLYWLLFLRTWPLHRIRNVSPPQGITAGELGCRLTLAGGDLSMMVMTWAQLGYIVIRLDERGRVMLHKRMEMGNERSPFENRVFKLLFASRNVLDATGSAYAKLCRKVAGMVPGERAIYRSSSGNMKLFRWLCCVSHVFCGICVAMNMTGVPVLQVILAILLGVLGAVTAWLIQEMAYRTHLRGKVPVYIGLVCIAVWILLGLLAGQVWIPLGSVLGQYFLGYFAAYGGRRSEAGRHDAALILGLRVYLKKVRKEDLDRLLDQDPDYFFQLAPYALALGVIKPFAANFGLRRLEQCPYIVTRVQGRRTAQEWAQLLSEVADAMDERTRRAMVERWVPIHFR